MNNHGQCTPTGRIQSMIPDGHHHCPHAHQRRFPMPPNVVDPAFRQQALQVNHHKRQGGQFNAMLLANVNNNATAAHEQGDCRAVAATKDANHAH